MLILLPRQKVDNVTRERYLKLCNGLTATPLPIPFVFLGDRRPLWMFVAAILQERVQLRLTKSFQSWT